MTRLLAEKDEIGRLFAVARREVADAAITAVSTDGRFEHAYAAALAAATIVVRSEGERVHGADHHRLTFEALAEIASGRWRETAEYFQHCRRRRNVALYDRAGVTSASEVESFAARPSGSSRTYSAGCASSTPSSRRSSSGRGTVRYPTTQARIRR